IAALAHDVPIQNAALRGVDQVFDRGSEHVERPRGGVGGRCCGRRLRLRGHSAKSFSEIAKSKASAAPRSALSQCKQLRPKFTIGFDIGQRTAASLYIALT